MGHHGIVERCSAPTTQGGQKSVLASTVSNLARFGLEDVLGRPEVAKTCPSPYRLPLPFSLMGQTCSKQSALWGTAFALPMIIYQTEEAVQRDWHSIIMCCKGLLPSFHPAPSLFSSARNTFRVKLQWLRLCLVFPPSRSLAAKECL